ncbi:MAG: hypothetical protein KDA05_01640 [Phycisphaerales bacterium]|nr:hypothetical protein [Phycisphaerales bacterium]MCB9840990.1 hypothetical protein [Phycisphaeraceae bacterium]
MTMIGTRASVAAAVLAAAGATASAGVLIDGGPSSTLQTFSTGNYVAGSEFVIDSPMTIRGLGWIDAEGDGLTNSHRVGLWDVATQALLAEATVTPASMTIPSAQGTALWFFEAIADLNLPAGTYRVAGEVNGDNVTLSNDKIAAPGVTLPSGYVRTDFPNGGFAYPNLSFGSQAVRASVTDMVVPAPAGVLAMAGLVAPLARRRRA